MMEAAVPDYGPSLTACKLWQKTSAKGNVYFTGRLGGLKVTILANRDKANDEDADWVMVFGEAAPYQPRATPQSTPPHEPPPQQRLLPPPSDGWDASPRQPQARAWSKPTGRATGALGGPRQRLVDDAIPF